MILKIGSKGDIVKDLQEFLELKADGIFGKGTEHAVKIFQSKMSLIVDGMVGPKTMDLMGLVSTDLSEKTYVTENDLLINTHFLPKGEYKEGAWNNEYVFIHHTAGWHNPYNCIDQWARDNRGAVATEFVLGGPSIKGNDNKYDGEVVQAFPQGGYGWHLGKNGSQHMHIHSVGIEVNNFGYLKSGRTYAGQLVDDSQVVTLSEAFRGFKEWHRYSNKQIESLKKLILHIADRDNINVRDGLPSLIKKNGAKAFEFNEDAYYGKVKGLWTHTNTRKDKFDMFPQQELLDMLVSL
jgi:hypothetical protein|tara:strand:+ start:1110 stop:1991 length:882 start_codon:yes stop_codon:yes gene_type:complete